MDVARFHSLIRLSVALMITLVILLHSSGKLTLPLLDRIEAQAYDARVRLNLGDQVDPRIVIIDIDERSLQQHGRWPWHRDLLATLVDRLIREYGVSLIGFDMVFAEPDEPSGLKVLQQLENQGLSAHPELSQSAGRLRQQLQYDEHFAQSLSSRPVVLGFFFQSGPTVTNDASRKGQLPSPLQLAHQDVAQLPIIEAVGYGANIPVLQQAASGAGFIDIPRQDEDGVIRKAVMLQEYAGKYYPSLALSMILNLFDNPPLELVVADQYRDSFNYGLEQLKLAEGFHIPVDEHGAALVPYRNHYPAFPYISATDVIHGRVDSSQLENTIVLIGTTAAGLLDNRSTPVQSVHPGVEVHASLVAGILDQALLHQPAYMRGIDLVILLILASIMIWWLPRLAAMGTVILSTALAVGVVFINYLLWKYGLLVLPITYQLALILALFVFYSSFGFFVENRAKRILTRRFGQYVPPEIVEEMGRAKDDYGLQGQTRHMTVMFTDIRGFTEIADGLPPKQLTQLMDIYLTAMTRVIHQHRGTIDKYIGDAIMAFWGAPLYDPMHPRHAVDAAFEMLAELEKVNEQLQRKGMPVLQIGIGINSGEMNVGNMGSRFRMAYTVMGDAVNLASRYEELTKHYQVPVIVGEATMQHMADCEFRLLDKVRFKGKSEVTSLYQPIGKKSLLAEEHVLELQQYHLALQAYYSQSWGEARDRFEALCQRNPHESLYRVYATRVSQLERHPPGQEWDKVWLHDTVKEILE
ncbi:MAG: adenylate/guanylate cyclase domain-containing protein [Gammaproteobacteria bacterium]|nr:adenylate/guanylate cyclase domain-containing protein [Gammaproteobacteria bacterium]